MSDYIPFTPQRRGGNYAYPMQDLTFEPQYGILSPPHGSPLTTQYSQPSFDASNFGFNNQYNENSGFTWNGNFSSPVNSFDSVTGYIDEPNLFSTNQRYPTPQSPPSAPVDSAPPPEHECTGCHKTFTILSSLQRHKRRCLKQKTKSCTHCSKKFSEERDLVKHINTVHRDRLEAAHALLPPQYFCHVLGCQKAMKPYGRKDNFARHLRDVHHLSKEEAARISDDLRCLQPRQS